MNIIIFGPPGAGKGTQSNNIVKDFNLIAVPTTILINKNGEEFARIIGEVNFQDKKFLKWLLKYD